MFGNMNKTIGLIKGVCILTGMFLSFINAYSQDILVKKNGDEIEVKVSKISDDEIEYKRWSNPDGPSYVVSKSKVFMIKYMNGDKDVFNETSVAAPTCPSVFEDSNTLVKAMPCADNAALIEEFNKVENGLFDALKAERKDKEANLWYGTLGVTKSSVLSSDEIQISFYTEKKSYPHYPYNYNGSVITGLYGEKYTYYDGKFCIEIMNKTSQTIYLDKANTFRIEPNGSYYCYYNLQQTTVNQGSGSGASLNLGAVTGALGIDGVANTLAQGVNVGRGQETSVSTTYIDQRVVAIPPHGKMILSKDNPIVIKRTTLGYDKFKMDSFSEDFANVQMPSLQRGEYKMYSEQDTPATKRYILKYSLDPEFKSSKQLEFGVYIKEAIGNGKRLYSEFEKIVEKISGQKGISAKSVIIGHEL